MQTATPPIHGAAAVRTSSSAPASSTTAARSLSALDTPQRIPSPHGSTTGIAPDQALRFVANHHRQHNPNDPKLRANPSFKSRRSSLLGSVLKSKSKDDYRKLAKAPVLSRPTAPVALQPRASSATAHHQHTRSLPSADHDRVSQQAPHATVDSSSSRNANVAKQQDSGAPALPAGARSENPHPLSQQVKARHFHLGDSPPVASFPSPVDSLPEGSASTCSSANAKSIHFASIAAPATSPSMDAAFLPTDARSPDAAERKHRLAASTPTDAATVADPPSALPNHASSTASSSQAMHEQSTPASSSPAVLGAVSSQAAAAPLHASSPTSPPSRDPLPIITRTVAPDNSMEHQLDPDFRSRSHVAQDSEIEVASALPASRSCPPAMSSDSGPSEQPSDATVQRLPHSASAFVTSPQRFSSLGRRSAAPLTLDTDLQGPASLPRGLARDINDELDSPTSPEMTGARAERRMSMLDFLAADPRADAVPQLAQASLSAEDLPRSVQPASRSGHRSSALMPTSIPLMQASRQWRLEAAAALGKTPQPRKIDLCDHVRVSVEPLIDRLTMFGSMQSSSNYSLAGTVVVEVPKLNVPRLSAAAAVAPDGSTSDHPSVHVEALTIRFIGYSVYVDATGRFNAVKLAEISQELLQPQGFHCPVEMVETSEQLTSPEESTATSPGHDASRQSLKYETEFDLSIPGWLPASQRSRFGATFYCVQATAVVQGQAILSALSGFDGFGSDGWQAPSSASTLARSLESELSEAGDSKSPSDRKDGARLPSSGTLRSKTKNTWLNKTAKQLQLRTSRKSSGPDAEGGSSLAVSRRGSGPKEGLPASAEQDPLFSKSTEASNQLLPNGQHSIRSECLSILVRRCRDVVPVPVARLARLSTPSQLIRADGVPPSLSQSMLALARLHEGSEPADAAESTPALGSTAPVRSHLPISASAPVSLASLAEGRELGTERASANPLPGATATLSPESRSNAAGSDVAADAPAQSALAPSPRIDADARGWGSDRAETAAGRPMTASSESEPSAIMPRAPSAFDAPRDPAKLAAATSGMTPSATLPNLPISMSRASSLLDSRFGNAHSPPRTSSRSASVGRSSAPLRHFVHRPTLHLPPELGVTPDKDAAGGLNFSLTLSLPSHVHVAGPKSDLLSFGVQIEVGRTEGWEALKQWGGLRLKDMELVCLQTERHSSMPSRSFCAAFPVPPHPNKVDAADLPVVTSSRRTSSTAHNAQQLAEEKRLRQSYDRSLVLGHIALANQGKAPHPIEHNVERIRTTIVGPPPIVLRKRGQDPDKEAADRLQKGKAKINPSGSLAERPNGFARTPSRSSPAGSGTNTPDGTSQSTGISSLRAAFAPAAQVNSGSRASVMQPIPRALARSNNSSSSSLRQAFQGSDGSGTMQPAPRPSTTGSALAGGSSPSGPVRSRRPIPFDLGAASETVTTSRSIPVNALHPDTFEPMDRPFADAATSTARSGSQAARAPARGNPDGAAASEGSEVDARSRSANDSTTTRMGVSSSVSTRSSTRPAPAPRRSRFETAISRLSTFASSMLEQPTESAAGPSQDSRSNGSTPADGTNAAAASLRATYAFSGDDGQGVDLTKGRVRMTINLPLVSSDLDAARKAGSAQLIPDFESPYVRIRHKLKVKLGFGLIAGIASGQDGDDWAQALVMCVPVRFTEAPPKEVQEQFGPVRLTPGNAQTASSEDGLRADRSRADSTLTAGQGPNPAAEGSAEARATSGIGLPETFAEPLLPAYAQLFREDGSRLADEGEDLPRYPGRMSVVGEIDEDPISDTAVLHGAHDVATTADELSTVDETGASGSDAPEVSAASATGPGNLPISMSGSELARGQAATLPRLASFGAVPTPMDRTTSLPGRRMLTRTSSSGIHGLRSSPSHPALPSSSHSVTSSPFSEKSRGAGTSSRIGSSVFDPLPSRPGMRRRSATTTSLVTFSRITPAEVLDEALVTSALDDEEDRMDGMPASHTLDSLSGRQQRGHGGMSGSGQDEDEDEDEDEEGVEGMDEEDVNMDGADSPEIDSESGHAVLGMHLHTRQQLSGSEDQDEMLDVEVGRAL